MSLPKSPSPLVQINIRCPLELKEQLEKAARRSNRTFTAFLLDSARLGAALAQETADRAHQD